MGSIASSMAIFRRCIKNFDKVPDVYNYYGELLLDQQKYQEAIEKFDTAVEMEKQTKPLGMNVLPLINKALALFQWKQDFQEAEKLCQKALISMYHTRPSQPRLCTFRACQPHCPPDANPRWKGEAGYKNLENPQLPSNQSECTIDPFSPRSMMLLSARDDATRTCPMSRDPSLIAS